MSRQKVGTTLSVWRLGGEKSSGQTKRPCCRVWPNGEWGLGYGVKTEASLETEENRAGGVSRGFMAETALRVVEDAAEPLDLTSPVNSHSKKPRGLKGMTGYGAKMVRNSAYLMQNRYGRRNLTFLTLTIPPVSHDAGCAIAGHWGESVRKLLQMLKRRLRKAKLPTEVVLVTELQSRRLKASQSACLHAHVVFVGRFSGKAWALSPGEVRDWWCAELSRVAGCDVYSGNCVDMKAVERDAANYLSKYMSKGAGDIEEFAKLVGVGNVPSTWWNMSAQARASVRQAILSGDAVAWVLDEMVRSHIRDGGGWGLKFVKPIEMQLTEYQTAVIGYWGVMDRGAMADLTAMVKFD